MNTDLNFRIVLENPTPGVDFGLQKGRGSNYETLQKQRSSGADLIFEFTLSPDLRGPVVQGPPGARFVYLDIGTYAGQIGSIWGRRLKVPLQNIPDAQPSSVLEARVAGTGRDGGPNSGTVKPFGGWQAVPR